jgi:hypothetical protein
MPVGFVPFGKCCAAGHHNEMDKDAISAVLCLYVHSFDEEE